MRWQYTPYALPLLFSAAVSAALGLYAWRRRAAATCGKTLALLGFAVAQYSLVYALELLGGDLPTKIFWAKLDYLGIVSVAPLFLAFALQYAGFPGRLSRRNAALLAVIPALTFLLAMTNEAHGLIWTHTSLQPAGTSLLLVLEHGTVFWLHAAYAVGLFLVGTGLVANAALFGVAHYRRQSAMLLAGLLLPAVLLIGYMTGISPVPHLNPTGTAVSITVALFTIAIFRFRLLELVPVARQILIERMRDGVMVVDAHGCIVDLNPALERALGRRAREVIGKPAREALADWPQLVPQAGDVLERQGEICLGEGPARRDYALSISPMRQERFAGHLLLLRDVTELKRAEEALRESEARYRQLFETSRDGIAITDLQARFLDCNRAYLDLLGYETVGELRSKSHEEVTPPEYHAFEATTIRKQTLARGYSDEYEKQYIRKTGSRIPVSLRVWLRLDTDNRPMGMWIVARDMTDHRRLQAQFLQAQKMESIGRLAGGMAHDFNNLLTAIMGYASFVRDALPPEAPAREDIDQVLRGTRRAAQLTQQLLAFSRRQPIAPRVVNLNDLICGMERLLLHLIAEDVELVMTPAPDLGLVLADPGQIEQLVVNLASNARDAMPGGGTLLIETANVTIDEDYARRHVGAAQGEFVLLAISDTGVGLSDEVKAHLFEPFFTTKDVGKGTGLGLATVFGIVRQHQGHIWVDGAPGQGATFRIYLPRVDARAEQPPLPDNGGYLPQGSETVLVVEDDPPVRTFAVRALSELGYAVLEAANGAEALSLAEQAPSQPVDLLVTDVVMPQMGGEVLAERLQALYPGMQVLFVSGYAANAVRQRGPLDENAAFLQKPFTLTTLARRVREALDA